MGHNRYGLLSGARFKFARVKYKTANQLNALSAKKIREKKVLPDFFVNQKYYQY